ALSQPAATGRPIGQHTIGPVSSRLGEGLAGRGILVPSRTSDSCGGPGAVHADTVARCTLASGLSGHCVKKQCGLAGLCFGGCTALDIRLSRARTGVAVI
ncbi:unnamed protein product, partial [Coregonus sp. 'balchen']